MLCTIVERIHPNRGKPIMTDNGEPVVLTIFVTGQTVRATRAIEALQSVCDSDPERRYKVKVVDVLDDPDEAERRKVLATPTVIKDFPPPIRRIVGDLSDKEKVLVGLDISGS